MPIIINRKIDGLFIVSKQVVNRFLLAKFPFDFVQPEIRNGTPFSFMAVFKVKSGRFSHKIAELFPIFVIQGNSTQINHPQ